MSLQSALHKFEQMKTGQTVITNDTELNLLSDYFVEHDGPDADLYFANCASVPNHKRVGILDQYVAWIGDMSERIFSGNFPTGIGYADCTRERHGDYVQLGFLSYSSLELVIEKDCPPHLESVIRLWASTLQEMRGQEYAIAGNMIITLGRK